MPGGVLLSRLVLDFSSFVGYAALLSGLINKQSLPIGKNNLMHGQPTIEMVSVYTCRPL